MMFPTTQRPAAQGTTQTTTRKVAPQGTTQNAPARRAVAHPANAPLPKNTSTQASTPGNSAPASTELTNPYKEGTKRFTLAQRLIAGELDRSRLAREIGVSSQTVYNVISDLLLHGYTLSVDVNAGKSPTSPTSTTPATSNSRSTTPPTPEETQSSSESRLPEETNSHSTLDEEEQSGSEEMQSRSKFNPGETTREEKSTQSRSAYSPGRSQRPTQAAPRGVTREDVVEIVGDAMKQLMETLVDPEMRQGRVEEDLTGVNLLGTARSQRPRSGSRVPDTSRRGPGQTTRNKPLILLENRTGKQISNGREIRDFWRFLLDNNKELATVTGILLDFKTLFTQNKAC